MEPINNRYFLDREAKRGLFNFSFDRYRQNKQLFKCAEIGAWLKYSHPSNFIF